MLAVVTNDPFLAAWHAYIFLGFNHFRTEVSRRPFYVHVGYLRLQVLIAAHKQDVGYGGLVGPIRLVNTMSEAVCSCGG